jgi:KDO2-lipid IV(A) lauroyltransferase
MPGWDHARRVAVLTKDEHLLRDPLARGQGVITALSHSGNWDHAGAWIAGTGQPFTTVAERLRPERLYERFVAYRESLGMEVLPLTGGADTFAALARTLKAGGLICLLADRDLSRTGVDVSFFGEPARMPGGPAALALMTGAVLLPTHVTYDGPDLRIQFGPVIEAPAAGTRAEKIALMTQQMADAFERCIAAHPEDWHMLARLWLSDLDEPAGPERAP